jgi:hypothetical protein
MPSCDYCKSFHLFGKKDASGNYCNDKCMLEARLKSAANSLPPGYIEQRIAEIHQGNCPRCMGPGPVDIHTSHEVWSAVVLTSWKSLPALSCKSCGVKRQLGGMAFCGFLGWWGFPFGLIITPVQLIRNFIGMVGGPNPNQPSSLLTAAVTRLAATERPITSAAGASAATGRTVPPPLPSNAG